MLFVKAHRIALGQVLTAEGVGCDGSGLLQQTADRIG